MFVACCVSLILRSLSFVVFCVCFVFGVVSSFVIGVCSVLSVVWCLLCVDLVVVCCTLLLRVLFRVACFSCVFLPPSFGVCSFIVCCTLGRCLFCVLCGLLFVVR